MKKEKFSVSFPLNCKWCHPAWPDESMASELVVAMSISAFTNAAMKFFMWKVKCMRPLTTWVVLVSRHPLAQAWGSKAFLCIWSSTFLWLFLETWGWTFFLSQTKFKSASLSFDCFIPYVSSVIITPGWFTLLSKSICLATYCGELSNCLTLKSPCWLRHGWCLTFTPLCQEKGHCYELMTEQCSATFDYPALYLCLPPPTIFSCFVPLPSSSYHLLLSWSLQYFFYLVTCCPSNKIFQLWQSYSEAV